MQTLPLSLLTAQIKNRVGLQPPTYNPSSYPTEGSAYPPSSGYDSYSSPASVPTLYGNTPSSSSLIQTPPEPRSNPDSAVPLALTATAIPVWKRPIALVTGGLTTLALGGLAYLQRDWIQDTLGIGGDAGKLERAKTQFTALKTKYTDAKTPEAKKAVVAEMLSVLERNKAALFNSLPKNGLNAYETELQVLKTEGKTFAEKALGKVSKTIVDQTKVGLETVAETIKTSGVVNKLIRVVAGLVALASGGAWLGASGIALSIGNLFGISTISTAATAVAAKVGTGAASVLGFGATTAVSIYTVADPNPLKWIANQLGGLVAFPFKAMGNLIKKLRP